jgi:phosphoenolpyruvate phosphomutase
VKVLILASGLGNRLKPLTNDIPKCLTPIDHRTILDYQLQSFAAANLRDIVITTGPFEEKLINFLKPYQSQFHFTLVKNELYAKTNYIYSIYQAIPFIQDDIILVHGDLVFFPNILTSLLTAPHKDAVLIKKNHQPQSDFKGLIENECIRQIGVQLFAENCHFLAPLYKFSQNSWLKWLNRIEQFIKQNQTQCYAENALNELLATEITLKPVYFDREICMEIDTMEDLNTLKARILQQN